MLSRKSVSRKIAGTFAAVGVLLFATPALAHHPFGGELPSTLFQGFLSGIGHPVIGVDHLAFVIAAGLVAATRARGFFIPLAFVAASLLGTILHLQLFSLPAPETVISASVLVFGIILAVGKRLNLMTVVALGALAGIFHGYAYGEAIFGAELSPMLAYLTGFAGVQLAIALSCTYLARQSVKRAAALPSLGLRFAGFTLAGFGLALFSSTILG